MDLCELKGVLKQVGQQAVLKNITLTIETGDALGIQMNHRESELLFQLLTGQQLPTSGTVNQHTSSVQTLLVDDGFYPSLTVNQYLTTFTKLTAAQGELTEDLQRYALSDVRQQKIKRLSDDQRYRLALLRAARAHPDLLLIESPLSKLTDAGTELYLQALSVTRQLGITVVVTAYALEELLLMSQIIYRYRAASGLEKTDLVTEQVDGAVAHESVSQRIFKVACKVEDKTVFFSPNEIDFIESINGVSQVNVNGEQFGSTQTMAVLEQQLTSFGFFRCHRSYLVNLQQISELISYSRSSYTLILKNKHKLPLSRTKLADLRQLINF